MLKHLTISHYALIDELDIDWQSGFSVITGETGAGKSIMLGALNLLTGGRADAKAIRNGHSKCIVEATFNIEGLKLEQMFAENDIDYDARECILRREVMQSGKSRAFVNDTPVSAAKLKDIGHAVIDIHSQHQNLLIRNENFLIDTLDTLAQQPETLNSYTQLYHECREAEQLLKELQTKDEQGRSDEEYLRFQLSQIEEAALKDDEQTELEQELNILGHAEEIKQALYTAKNLLESEELSMVQNLKQAAEQLNPIGDKLQAAADLAQRVNSMRIELDDIATELEQQADSVDYDPQRLLFVEERLDTLYKLEQKHHVNSIGELQDIARQLTQQLDEIENLDQHIAEQQKKVDQLLARRSAAAQKLTEVRCKVAKQLAAELTTLLQQLGMPHVNIELQISPRTQPNSTGADCVTFMFSANKNIPLQDVSQTASGGEIARVMLALKTIIARNQSLPTIVFDEIDTGVSGKMAEGMAKIMQKIAENGQVICITHLPQIAALGEHHLKVYKEEANDTTLSHIVPLDPDGRIEEIAHMLSGAEISQAAVENARTLLKQ